MCKKSEAGASDEEPPEEMRKQINFLKVNTQAEICEVWKEKKKSLPGSHMTVYRHILRNRNKSAHERITQTPNLTRKPYPDGPLSTYRAQKSRQCKSCENII